MTENSSAIIGTFLVYLAVMLVIGFWAWKQTSNSEDFFLGGRTLGPWPAALSAGASDMSGWLLLGLPGYAFAAGFEAFWLAGGLLIGTWLNWLIMAKRLRVYSEIADNALTLRSSLPTGSAITPKCLQLGFRILYSAVLPFLHQLWPCCWWQIV